MAENKGGASNIAKLVSKQAGRAKEKLLQNLGKADRTTDEIFEEHLQNFNLQQSNANRLQKDISNYIRCIRAMQIASKSLMESLSEVYENEWPGHDLLYVQSQNSEMLWADLAHKLSDQVLIPLNTYQGQFPEMRKKIEKRGRKLIDFDKERHNVQQLSSNPNRNEAKFARGKECMEGAKRTYEVLNSELHDELPALFDSRVMFLVTSMQTLFAAEEVFHSETAKVYSELEAIIDKLAKDVQKGTLPKRMLPKPQPLPASVNNSTIHSNSMSNLNTPPKGESNSSTLNTSSIREVQSLYLFNPTQLSPIHEPDSESVLSCGESSLSGRVNGDRTEKECEHYDELQDLEDCDQLLLVQLQVPHQQQPLPHQLSNGIKLTRMIQNKTSSFGNQIIF